MAIFTHVTVGTNDLAKARAFYDAVLAPLGYKRIKDLGDRGSCWGQSAEEFMVLTPADGKPANPANGGTVSFEAPSRAAVAAFHKAALALGAPGGGTWLACVWRHSVVHSSCVRTTLSAGVASPP